MTPQIIMVLSLLSVAAFLLVTEWVPMEVVAMLVMGSVVLTGLVEPLNALAGFSNPAVITVWAVFILSSGLTKTGVANGVGKIVLNLSGKSEASIIGVIMALWSWLQPFLDRKVVLDE